MGHGIYICIWFGTEYGFRHLIFVFDIKLQKSPKNLFFSLMLSLLNRYKMEIHHFYLNHLISISKLKSKSKEKQAIIYYAVCSHYVLPRNESPSLSDLLSQDALIWLPLPAPGKLFCLAYSINSSSRSPFLTLRIQQTIFLGHQRRNGESLLLMELSSCQVPKCSHPFLKMLNTCSYSRHLDTLCLWVTPS